MILLSLALVVASAAALGWGIATASEQLVWGALVAGLAAVALVAGSVVRLRRRLAEPPAPPSPGAAPPSSAPSSSAPPGPAQVGWPWSPDAAGTVAPPRSGWTGPAGPPSGPPPDPAQEWAGPPPPAGADQAGAASQPAAADQPGADRAAAGVQPAAAGQPGAADQVGAMGRERESVREEIASALGVSRDRPLGEPFPEDGEPPVEDVPVRDALRVAQLADDVRVLDGHPRYHLDGCPTLTGTDPVPIPVSAARRAGFTPCAVCGPDRILLARARDRSRPPAAD
jgi:hypothetical protein